MKTSTTNFRKNKIANLLLQSIVLVTFLSFFRCAPLSSEMQGARLVGKHKVEITKSYASVQFGRTSTADERWKKMAGRSSGMHVAYGLSEKVDLRFRYENLEAGDQSITVYSIGPKIRLVKDRVALYLPMWFVNNTPAQFQPTVLFTLPLVPNKIDFNPSVKNILSVGGYDPTGSVMVAFNAGLSISTDLSKFAVRPEYGIVYDLNRKTQYTSFGIGLSMNLSRFFGK